MADRHVSAAARAIRAHQERHHSTHERGPRYATVTDVEPIQATLTDADLELTDDDLVLSQWVRKYDASTGVAVGDTLLVSRMTDGDWLVQDVIAEVDPASDSGGGDYVTTFTTSGAGSDTITHNLGTTDVIVQAHQVSSGRSESFFGASTRVLSANTVAIVDLPSGSGAWRAKVLPVVP